MASVEQGLLPNRFDAIGECRLLGERLGERFGNRMRGDFGDAAGRALFQLLICFVLFQGSSFPSWSKAVMCPDS